MPMFDEMPMGLLMMVMQAADSVGPADFAAAVKPPTPRVIINRATARRALAALHPPGGTANNETLDDTAEIDALLLRSAPRPERYRVGTP